MTIGLDKAIFKDQSANQVQPRRRWGGGSITKKRRSKPLQKGKPDSFFVAVSLGKKVVKWKWQETVPR